MCEKSRNPQYAILKPVQRNLLFSQGSLPEGVGDGYSQSNLEDD